MGVSNMITGVTRGFQYKMRIVYAHFPINLTITGNTLEIRNFLGEKNLRGLKDEILIKGNDLDAVSKSAAMISHCCKVRQKDLRKFLDGIYVSDKGCIAK